MEQFDIILAGSGAAGLSLAYYLSCSPALKNRSVLLLDKDLKNQNDRTWGFWTSSFTEFDQVVSFRFDQAEFISRQFSALLPLRPYQYQVIEGDQFYAYVKDHLQHFSNFHFRQEEILEMKDTADGAQIVTPMGQYQANWIFNSCFLEDELKRARKGLYLQQHFKGWTIKTPEPVFEPDRLRLFDFRTPQQGSMRFFYLIPQARDRALVEYTLFSTRLLEPSAYEAALQEYILNVLQIKEYNILDKEWGIIPMTTHPFPPRKGKRILNIGTLSGASKPSTGYTFLRIQHQCQMIVKKLEKGEEPLVSVQSPARFRLYDQMLLNLMDKKGELSESIFSQLFQNNSCSRILKFLDEDTSILEELMIMNSVPRSLFIRSLLNLKWGFPFQK